MKQTLLFITLLTLSLNAHAYQNDLASMLDLLNAYQGITQRTSDHKKALENLINKEKNNFDIVCEYVNKVSKTS